MTKRNYYSVESAHGSATSYGFANDHIVYVFADKKSRDEYVKNSDNLSCRAIYKNQATNEARNCGENEPRPFSGEYWGIDSRDLPRVAGIIGTVSVSRGDDLERFYK